MNIQTINNVADCVPLYLPQSLYLKPLARINISVSLPVNKMGKSISNLDIMDKLTNSLKPDKFLLLKVVKSTVDVIRFEAEMDERSKLKTAISRLDGISLKVNGFSTLFKVRASEPKDDFPTRHDWDAFFRDATYMDEMKAGERPDTIHFSNLPIRWFCPRHMENNENVKPSENIFKRIFEKFGAVRCVDIPICDIYRSKMNADINGMNKFGSEQDFFFEGYVQFEEYVGFVRAMDEFRGMKLLRKFVDKTEAINISVTFDKTKHLSDASIQRRERVRKRLMSKAQAEKDEDDRLKKAQQEKVNNERKIQEQLKSEELERQRQREEIRKEKRIKKMQERGQLEISHKIRLEEKKLLIAQRKLESIRILGELFARLKLKQVEKTKLSKKKDHITLKNVPSDNIEKTDLRDKLVEKYKLATEKLLKKQKEKLQEIKHKTPIIRLVQKNISRKSECSNESASFDNDSIDENGTIYKRKQKKSGMSTDSSSEVDSKPNDQNFAMNPFKMSMFPYVPPVFPGMPIFRPNMVPHMFPTMSMYRPSYSHQSYRGFAPRNRGRGRGGGYDVYPGQSTTYGYNKNYRRDTESRNYSRSRSRSRFRTRSRSRSRSRTRTRSRKKHYFKRSKSKVRSRKRRSHSRSRTTSSSRSSSSSWSSSSRSRHRSRSERRSYSSSKGKMQESTESHTKSARTKQLVSTRRSCSSPRCSSHSDSRSKRTWSKSMENISEQHQYSTKQHRSRSPVNRLDSRKKNYETTEDGAVHSRRSKSKKKASAEDNIDVTCTRRNSIDDCNRSRSRGKCSHTEMDKGVTIDDQHTPRHK